jgi:DNA-3-methyladenine glycosylase I
LGIAGTATTDICTAATTTPNGANPARPGRAVRADDPGGLSERPSWLIILRKRDNFRHAFDEFDIEKIAGYGDDDGPADGRCRHRAQPAKIDATIANARVAADPDDDRRTAAVVRAAGQARPAAIADVAAVTRSPRPWRANSTPRFRFVGPTTAYALMQATGMVDDHVANCWFPRCPRAASTRVLHTLVTR